MPDFHTTQIEWMLALQQIHTPALDAFFEFITRLGGRLYLMTVPLVLWGLWFRTGLRVLCFLVLTAILNGALKEWFGHPRPFEVEPRIVSDGELGYGLPSGHAQLAVAFWGALADRVGRRWFWGVAVGMMTLIGVSRIYLGVHFPTDVLAGWALGGAGLWIYLRYRPAIEAWLATLSHPLLAVTLAGLATLAFMTLVVGDPGYFGAGSAGMLIGAGIGGWLALRHLDFDAGGAPWRRALRLALGLAVMGFVLGVMQRVGAPDGWLGRAVVTADLAIFGLYLTFGAPWLFGQLWLGSPAADPATPAPAAEGASD